MTVFEERAAAYDAWYDTPSGAALFATELDALRPLFTGLPRPWLEVGVGTGRFAAALGVDVGLDPALGALALARDRGGAVVAGTGEAPPFANASFGAVLFVVTLCFVSDPRAVLGEARRILAPGGGVVLGIVPAESPWGLRYQQLAASGHPYYRHAHFFTRDDLGTALRAAGFTPARVRSTLLWGPEMEPPSERIVREGWDSQAGFAAVLAAPSRAE